MERMPTVSGTANLLDILDRVLDKGLVIAGDIRISLANVELLTIRIRLLVCSVDKAEEIGLNWWKFDPNLTHPAGLPAAPRRRLPRAVPGAALRAPAIPAKTARKVAKGKKR
ncbi:MAG TPA: gas vesicle protein [Terriglobales bacterium]|nr:gas vesicle protein [Terriglobales bacterium]